MVRRLRPVHVEGDCEVLLATGHLCGTHASFTMVRNDTSSMVMCTKHADQLRSQIEQHPNIFEPLRFTAIH